MATLSPSQLVMEPTLPSILAQHWSADPHSTSPLSSPRSLVRKPEQGISKITIPIVSSYAFISRSSLELLSTACDTSVNVTISFGGKRSWTISSVDFQLTKLTKDTCLGAFFELQSGSSAPSWIVGDTFLVRFTFTELRGITLISLYLPQQKNVYSVFRYSPLSIGFADLSSTAIAANGVNRPPPNATIGSVGATVSATSRSSTRNSGAQSLHTTMVSKAASLVAVAVLSGFSMPLL